MPSNSTLTRSSVRRSGDTTLNIVVLPAPLGPISPQISFSIDRERQVVERDDTTEPHGHFSNIE